MATNVGDVKVTVLPNAQGFHKEAREQIRQQGQLTADVKLLADDKEFQKQMKELEAQIERVEKQGINIPVKLDYVDEFSNLERLIQMYDGREMEIFINAESRGIVEAEAAMDALSARDGEIITQHVEVDHSQAEEALNGMNHIRNEIETTPIIQRILFDVADQDMPDLPDQKRNTYDPTANARKRWQSVLTLHKDFFDLLSEQMDSGIERIYNPYLDYAKKFGAAAIKPVQSFRADIKNAQNYVQVLDVVKDRFERIRSTVDGRGAPLLDGLRTGLSWLKREGTASFEPFRRSLSSVRSMAGKTKNLVGPVQHAMAGMGRAVADGVSAFGEVFAKGFLNIGRGMGRMLAPVKQAFSGVSSVVGGALKNLTPKFAQFAVEVGSKFTKSLGSAGKAVTLLGGKLGKLGGILKFFGTKNPFGAAIVGFSTLAIKGFSSVAKALPTSKVFKKINDILIGRMMKYATGGLQIATGMFMKFGSILAKSVIPMVMATAAGFAALGGQAIVGGILALGGAIGAVAQGAILMAPALGAAAGISFAALKLGLEGVSTGVKSAFAKSTPEEFEKAIAKLPPKAQEVARAFREFQPAFQDMKDSLQTNMLDGLAPKITSAMNNLFPVFSSGLGQIGSAWNASFGAALEELSSERASAGLETIMAGVNDMAVAMEPVIANILAGFGSLAEQGAQFLGPIGEVIAGISQDFADWAEGLKKIEDGTPGLTKFQVIAEKAKTAFGQLRDILGGLGGTLWNVFSAANEGGQGMLNGMATAMQGLKDSTAEGTQGFKDIKMWTQEIGETAKSLVPLFEPLIGIVATVGGGLANLAQAAAPGVTDLLNGLLEGLKPIFELGPVIGENIGNIASSLGPVLEVLGKALAPIIEGLGGGLEAMIVPIADAFAAMGPTLQQLGETMGPLFVIVGEVLGKIGVAAMPIVENLANLLIQFAPLLQEIFLAIGDVVVKVFEVLGPLIEQNIPVIQQLVEALLPVIPVIAEGLVGALDAIAPLLPMITELFARLITEVLIPILPMIIELVEMGFKILIQVIQWLMQVIAAIFPVFLTLIDIWGAVAGFLYDVLLVAVKVVWATISTIITGAINFVIVPILKVLSGIISWLGDIFVAFVSNFIRPTFDLFMVIIRNVAGFFTNIVTGDFNGALENLKNLFRGAVDWIKEVWNGLKRIFAKPIKFFIETVLNGGLIDAWNWVVDKVPFMDDDKKWTHVKVPEGLNFASGGVLPGHSVGRDNLHFRDQYGRGLSLAGGEGIMRQEFVSAVGGERGVKKLNEDARHGRLKTAAQDRGVDKHGRESAAHASGGVFQALANGGVVEAMTRIVQQKYPMLQMTSGYDNRPGNHGRGLAADFSNGSGNTPAQLSLARDIAKTYPNSMELIYDSPGWSNNLKNGQNVGAFGGFYNMAQAGPHHHHVHWGMNTPPTMPFGGGVFAGGSDGGGGGGGGFLSSLYNMTIKPFIDKAWEKVSNRFGEPLKDAGKYIGSIPKAVGGGLWDSFTEWIPSLFPGGDGGDAGNIDTSGVAGSNIQIGQELAKRAGWTGGEWEALKQLWHNESGWNNNAQNPASTAYGIPQFLDSTWATVGYQKTSDAATQIAAGIKYIKQRPDYAGSPSRALALWQSRSPHWYDQGGEASGIGVMQKNVLKPERVLSPRQTEAFNDFVFRFMPELINDFRKRPFSIQEGVRRISAEIRGIPGKMAVSRQKNIDRMTDGISANFKKFIAGERSATALDSNYDAQWFNRNGGKLQTNISEAIAQGANAASDPWGYLAAEEAAKERIEKEKEEAAKTAEQESDEKKREAENKERDKRAKTREEELEKAKSDEEKDAIKTRHEQEDKNLQKKEEAERKIQDEKDRAEQERIDKMKETGEYYYGYKVFSNDGKNPNEREETDDEKFAKQFASEMLGALGLGSETDAIIKRIGMVQSLGSAVQTATPAWMAAANGNPAGLNHNIAVGTSLALDDSRKEAKDLAPSLLATSAEMLGSGIAVRQAPLVGTVNTGVTEAQLYNTLDRYGAVEARRKGGTVRTR